MTATKFIKNSKAKLSSEKVILWVAGICGIRVNFDFRFDVIFEKSRLHRLPCIYNGRAAMHNT